MPLNQAGLQSALQELAEGPGATTAACAQAWAEAIRDYTAGIIPPSTTLAAAATVLQASFAVAFSAPSAAAGMEAALTTFGATLGGGMAPGFVAVPPAAPVGLASLFVEPYPSTHADAALAVANAIDTWMRTGTAAATGGGAPAPWA